MVVKIKEPNGVIRYYAWIKGKYGYWNHKGKIKRYPLKEGYIRL
jgi:hypothetical protein